MTERKNGLTYADSGVDIDAGNRLVDLIKPLVRATARPGADAVIGGFGGLFDPKAAGFKDPVLVGATDGVGTKIMVAIEAGLHAGIGIDLVAMSVNDLVVQGAEPLFFLDYFATGRLDVQEARTVLAGVASACRAVGCALIGGETAEMPGLYRAGDYDLAGFAVGAVERGAVIDGSSVVAGDVVLGLESSGLHANGFSLVRSAVAASGLDYAAPAPFAPETSLGAALLVPTRLYVQSCRAAIAAGGVKALAHITGGGLVENVPRVLPATLAVEIDGRAWTPPPVFGWLAATAQVAPAEMARTFNCGIGMIVVAAAASAAETMRVLGAAGERVHRIGRIVPRAAGAPGMQLVGTTPRWPG